MPILVKVSKVMTSEVEKRPRFVTAGYGRHRSQWVKQYICSSTLGYARQMLSKDEYTPKKGQQTRLQLFFSEPWMFWNLQAKSVKADMACSLKSWLGEPWNLAKILQNTAFHRSTCHLLQQLVIESLNCSTFYVLFYLIGTNHQKNVSKL